MFATVTFWNKAVHGYTMQVPEPIRPFAVSYLAASGMFDRIVIRKSDGVELEVGGADLLKCADQVGPREER